MLALPSDIDECKLPDICANGGVCKNKPGGFDCPCKFGMKNDGKGGNCAHEFTTAAKATVGKHYKATTILHRVFFCSA